MEHINSIDKAISVKSQSVISLKNEFGEKKTGAILKYNFLKINFLLDLRKPMTSMQIDRVSSEIMFNYPNLTMADIQCVFSRAINGEYGELYESLGIAKVLKWFRDYDIEKGEHIYQQGLIEHSSTKAIGIDVRKTAPLSKEGIRISNYKQIIKENHGNKKG